MTTGKFMSPGCEEFARLVVNDDVIFDFVGDHDEPAFFIHYHLMAILNRRFFGIEISPGLMYLIPKIAMTNNFFLLRRLAQNIENRETKGCTCQGSGF